MLFIRISDYSAITTPNPNKPLVFATNKRKGNTVTKFNIVDGNIRFIDNELISKMIPKNSKNILKDNPIKIISVQSGRILAFQELEDSAYFLKLNDETGKIEKVKFEDLVPNEDSILCYDGFDWYLDDIVYVVMIMDDNYEENIDDDEIGDSPELSSYIISTEDGIIVNDIMICGR